MFSLVDRRESNRKTIVNVIVDARWNGANRWFVTNPCRARTQTLPFFGFRAKVCGTITHNLNLWRTKLNWTIQWISRAILRHDSVCGCLFRSIGRSACTLTHSYSDARTVHRPATRTIACRRAAMRDSRFSTTAWYVTRTQNQQSGETNAGVTRNGERKRRERINRECMLAADAQNMFILGFACCV